jgi:protein TonB
MKEKGGHLGRAFALALGAHALLFVLFAHLIRNAAAVPVAGVQPIEIQLSGPGTPGQAAPGPGVAGAPGGGTPRAPRTHLQRSSAPVATKAPKLPLAPSPQTEPQRPVTPDAGRQPQQPVVPAPQPSEASTAAPRPTTAPAAAAASPPASPGSDSGLLGTGGGWGDLPDGSGAGGGGAGGSTGSPSPGGSFPAAVSDIDPTPIRPLTAPYPANAKRLGQQGLVKIRADVDNQGFVVGCRVVSTSGYASLDSAAVQAVRSARFLPARKNGRTVASSIIIPVRFKLTQE